MVQASEEIEYEAIPQAIELFAEMNNNVAKVSQLIDGMISRVKSGELSTEKGLSYLEMKYQMLLSYLINLTYIILRKSSGETIVSDPAIDRLIEIRTALEKIRPIDSKLKYQIDKLVKTSVEGTPGDDDPHLYRPNPDNLVSRVQEDSEDSGSDGSETENLSKPIKSNVYVPPKLAAVHYDDQSKQETEKKLKEKARKQMLNSSVMRELREEYSDAPMELSSGNHVKHSISKYEQEKTEYEENYMTRLPVTKAEKNRRKKMMTIGMIADEVTGKSSGSGSSKKRKLKTKKGKGFKKRRF